MKDAVEDWLRCSSNTSQSGFSTVCELYLLHILIPMGHTTEALELLESDVGQVAFTEEQRQAARSLEELQKEKNATLSNLDSQSVALTTTTASQKGLIYLLKVKVAKYFHINITIITMFWDMTHAVIVCMFV